MQIIFHGDQTTEEAAESLLSILKLFRERYGIADFREMMLHLTLVDETGEEVELVDGNTSEVLGVFEVFKSGAVKEKMYSNEGHSRKSANASHLTLVVDNTKVK